MERFERHGGGNIRPTCAEGGEAFVTGGPVSNIEKSRRPLNPASLRRKVRTMDGEGRIGLAEAIERIGEIHGHLAKQEVYRGYRPVPVAVSGFAALAAALAEPRLLGAHPSPHAFVAYWMALAAFAMLLPGLRIAHRHLTVDDELARGKTRRVLGQLVPSLAAGGGLTAALLLLPDPPVALLPGLWALVFGLGMFASRPYLPKATGWVALFYFAAGLALLAGSGDLHALSGWRVAGVFGPGQIVAALVLRRNLGRGEEE
jgi:hypothetical protein